MILWKLIALVDGEWEDLEGYTGLTLSQALAAGPYRFGGAHATPDNV